MTSMLASIVAFFGPSRSPYVSAGKLALFSAVFTVFFLFTGAFSFPGGGVHFIDWALAIVNHTILPATVAQRDVGYPLLLILSGFTLSHSFIGIALLQAAFAVLIPVLVFFCLFRASQAVAYYTAIGSMVSLAPYTYMKWIYHDEAYLFFTLLALTLFIEYLWTRHFRTLMFFTAAAIAASFSRSAGNYLFPLLFVMAYVLVRGSVRSYVVPVLVYLLSLGAYAWHRYEIFDMRHQQTIPSGAGLQAAYSTYVFMSDFGVSLTPDLGPNTKKLLTDLRKQLEPNVRESPLIKLALNTAPRDFLEKNFYAYTPDELVEKMETKSAEDYFWVLYSVEYPDDQLYLRVAGEIVRGHPLYVAQFVGRNFWHMLFDPGYAITRYNMQGFLKTGNDFIPEQQGWGAPGQDTVTQYGPRAAREMELFQLQTLSPEVRKFFVRVKQLYQLYFDRYVQATSILMGIAWLGALFGVLSWIFPRTYSGARMAAVGLSELASPVIGATAFLFYEDLLTSVGTQPFYRYFHFTELFRIVIAGYGVVFLVRVIALAWRRLGAAGAGLAAKIQGHDALSRYFGVRPLQWISLVVVMIGGAFGWWASSIVANAWGAPQVEITDAKYGPGCSAGPAVVAKVREECIYNHCSVPVSNVIGADQWANCSNDFSLTYHCGRDSRPRDASLPKDAEGGTIDLDCYGAAGLVPRSAATPPPARAMQVLSATYGASCIGARLAPGGENWASQGNVTERVLLDCAKSGNLAGDWCLVSVDVPRWGDPAVGCGKDFSVSYLCRDEQKPRTAHLAAEASGKTVELDCRSAR